MNRATTEKEWKARAEAYLQRRYLIGLIDCTDNGEPPEYWADEMPEAWCDWIAEKYDLERIN